MSNPENVTPARKPNTPKTRGNGASALKPNTQRGTRPATNHAAAQVNPIPIVPRTRRSKSLTIASSLEPPRLGPYFGRAHALSVQGTAWQTRFNLYHLGR